MDRFNKALRLLARVSKADLREILEKDKMSKVGKPKRGPRPHASASDHVSGETD
jgi:hypothetical protein